MTAKQVIAEVLKRESEVSVCVETTYWSHEGTPRNNHKDYSLWVAKGNRYYRGTTYQECLDQYLKSRV
jgi:hypothetical protein